MKLFALTSLVVGSLIANQAFAGDISTQPLTLRIAIRLQWRGMTTPTYADPNPTRRRSGQKLSSIVLITIDKTKQQMTGVITKCDLRRAGPLV